VQNYGATIVAPIQTDQPLLSSKGTYFQTHEWCWNEENFRHVFAGKNQQQSTGLSWTNDLHGLDTHGFGVRVPVGA
jgi:hypothetical protein